MNSQMHVLVWLSVVLLFPTGKVNADKTTSILVEAQAALAAGDYDKAYAAYQIVAKDERNALAQFNLGLFYQNGWGRAKDEVAACRWFEQAAAWGVPTAQHLTGLCVEAGVHRATDGAEAAIWYQKAAQAGQIHAYCNLGNLFMHGKGVTKNPVKALELCYPVAQQGSLPAQIWMGKFYYAGDPAILDRNKAYQWFEVAAQKQSPEAFYYLGMMIHQDLMPQHTIQVARKMFEQAAALKYVPAYFQTGKSFFEAEPDPETNRLSAEHLAKAYLWLSATLQRSENAHELIESRQMLEQILAIMPEAWLPELDRKIAQHIQQ